MKKNKGVDRSVATKHLQNIYAENELDKKRTSAKIAQVQIEGQRKVIVAMSGGVDSSVAAKMIKNQGYDCLGIFLHFWKDPELAGNFENKCCSAKAFMDARRVCQSVGINLYTLNFAKEFKKDIVDNFLHEYKVGRTPNPCVRCNRLVKLGLLIERAKKLGYDKVASGHYARIAEHRTRNTKHGTRNTEQKIVYKLFKAKDREKDQSYFLWMLGQEELKHLIFPLGNFTKPEVRKMAKKYKLPVAEKRESQEVCFIPEKSHNEFLKRYIKLKPGQIKLLNTRFNKGGKGDLVGEHQGLPLYTIGQRRGIEIGGTGPYYAAGFDYKKNILYVVNNFDDPALYKDELIAKNINWIAGEAPKLPLRCEAVIRYRHKPVSCKVESYKIKSSNMYLVAFKKPQRAVTPGQSIVFYRGDEVLGGGIIEIKKNGRIL